MLLPRQRRLRRSLLLAELPPLVRQQQRVLLRVHLTVPVLWPPDCLRYRPHSAERSGGGAAVSCIVQRPCHQLHGVSVHLPH
jgi:hypothetical protein